MRMSVRRAGLWVGVMCVAALPALVMAGCGAFQESPPEPTPAPSAANLIANPGFELASDWMWTRPVSFSTAGSPHAGSSTLRLRVNGSGGAVDGAMQSVNTAEFPEFLSGFYRTDEWPDDGAYLQFRVRAATGAFETVPEVRFLIAGVASEPPEEPPASYVFLSRAAPAIGEWTYFAYPVRQAFRDETGAIPTAWVSVDVSLELRSTSDGADATAYFDDIYLGPQVGNPNKPKETTK